MLYKDLFSDSIVFCSLFVGKNGIYPDWDTYDKEEAQSLWDNRFPELNWGFCKEDGCKKLTCDFDEYCGAHSHRRGKMPKWQWDNGILYMEHGMGHSNMKRGYSPFIEYVSKLKYGKKPNGFIEYQIDQNPFNFHPENIVLISKIAFAAVRANVITIAEAVAMDEKIEDFIVDRWSGKRDGRRPFVGFYGYGDIVKASGVGSLAVRSAVSRGSLDPKNLVSVLEFVNKRKKRNNPELYG